MKKIALSGALVAALSIMGSAGIAQGISGTVTGASGNVNFPVEVTGNNGAVFFCNAATGAVSCIPAPTAVVTGAGAGAGGFGGLGLGAVLGTVVVIAVVGLGIGDSTSGTN